MKHCGTQELETERLILRRLSIDDSEMMYNNWASDRQVTQYLRWNAHRSWGETAEILGESTSLVRFWSNSFPRYIKPKRNAKGNRLFTAEDLECLKQIHLLVKEQGLTLEGAAKKMAADRKKVDGRVKALDSLKEIRRQLVEVKKSL